MKSRITIEVDFNDHNNPAIQIISYTTDDVRDKLLRDFLSRFNYQSSWCSIEWVENHIENAVTLFQRILIKPIPPHNLKNISEVMAEQSRLYAKSLAP